ncbi:MAG TPA: hypothetical protein VMU41_12120 [Candidatus Binataceae bacterium]|nr:hypothetical protein [Candidatus Binataceae bacterium]
MSINVKGLLGGAARVAAGAALLVAAGSAIAPAHAKLKAAISSSTGGTGPGPLLATYFDLGYWGSGDDGTVRLDNVSGANACAFIYVFDTTQELQESCAVGLSANKDYSFYTSSLVENPFYAGAFDGGLAGVIEIISGTPNTGTSPFASTTEGITCDPAAAITPITAVNAWISTVTVAEIDGIWWPGTTVLPFTDDGNPDAANLATIQNALGVLGSEIGATGDGVCDPSNWSDPSVSVQ